jgi:hypothetical protein
MWHRHVVGQIRAEAEKSIAAAESAAAATKAVLDAVIQSLAEKPAVSIPLVVGIVAGMGVMVAGAMQFRPQVVNVFNQPNVSQVFHQFGLWTICSSA